MKLQRFLFGASLFSLALIALHLFTYAPPDQETIAAPDSVSVRRETPAEPAARQTSLIWLKRSPSPQSEQSSLEETSAEEIPPISQFVLPDDPEQACAWARENPQEALAAITRVTSGASHNAVVETVCAQLANSDPAGAMLVAEQLGNECTNLLENLVEQWADRDEPAAIEYATDKPEGEDRDRLVGRVAFTLSRQNPVDAATLVAQKISPGIVQNEAAVSVLHQWSLHDPSAALTWAQSFPDDFRNRALDEIESVLMAGKE